MSRGVRAEDAGWDRSEQLSEEVIAALRQPPGAAVAIVATVDDDGAPRTATFGAMRPVAPDALRFACNRSNVTYDNIVRDGRMMVATFAPPDVAVGIRGRARVLRERMDTLEDNALVHVDIDEVKNDHLPSTTIASGITYMVPPTVAARLDAVNAELEAAAP